MRQAADQTVKAPENDFGVEIKDVRIKRADFPEAAQQNIFARMTAERQRISREFRAEGQEQRDTNRGLRKPGADHHPRRGRQDRQSHPG